MARPAVNPKFKTAQKLPPRASGRPKAAEAAALGDHLIAVAREVFFEVGFSSATMDAIAQRARVSKITLYSRYPQKAALFQAVAEHQLAAWSAGRSENNPPIVATTLDATVRHLVGVHVRAHLSPEFVNLTKIIMAEIDTFPDLARGVQTASHEERIVQVSNIIQHYAELDGIPCKNPDDAAFALRALVNGWLTMRSQENRDIPSDERQTIIDRISDLFMASRPAW